MAKYNFRQYQPLGLRIWHWLNALAILGLLGTVLLRKTFLSWRTNSALIEAKLQEAGTTITPELAKDIAVSIRTPMWDWHIYLGFALAGLIVLRVIVALLQKRQEGVFSSFAGIFRLAQVPSSEKPHALHYHFVKIGYATFYLATLFMVITGLVMQFKAELGLEKSLIGSIKEIHELMMWFFVVFVSGHILGIVVAENRGDKGLVSDMIHGGDK